MGMRERVPFFFAELSKISEDLTTPAVTAESNLTQGPPAAPWTKPVATWTRRRGYKKLEKVIEKEAGLASWLRLARMKSGRVQRSANQMAIKGYVSLPEFAQKGIQHTQNLVAGPHADSSDPSGSVLAQSAHHLMRRFF